MPEMYYVVHVERGSGKSILTTQDWDEASADIRRHAEAGATVTVRIVEAEGIRA